MTPVETCGKGGKPEIADQYMQVDVFPYSYKKCANRETVARTIEAALVRNGLNLISSERRFFKGFTAEDVRRAENLLFSPVERDAMARKLLIPLSPKKLSRLSRRVLLYVAQYSTHDASITVSNEAAARNKLPVMGTDNWLNEHLMLFGGFISIFSTEDEKIMSKAQFISKELRTSLGSPTTRS